MARRCFYSFYYDEDNWRAAQVRQMGVIEGNAPVSDNDWESITKGGDAAIQKWIDGQLAGKSCTIVLIGENTADRPWIGYEIKASWNSGKGLVGVAIHRLKDSNGYQSSAGRNPFAGFTLDGGKKQLSDRVKVYTPPFSDSKQTYAYIANNLADWVEEAVKIREGK